MPIFTAEERLGTTLAGKYRLERILGQGGMGVVFEAEHTWTGRKVALKLLHPHYAMEGAVVQRFLQEARTATAIRHSNVVEVLDMGSEEGTTYLVLELLQGEPLSAMLERGRLSLADTLGVLLPAMSALSIAHER